MPATYHSKADGKCKDFRLARKVIHTLAATVGIACPWLFCNCPLSASFVTRFKDSEWCPNVGIPADGPSINTVNRFILPGRDGTSVGCRTHSNLSQADAKRKIESFFHAKGRFGCIEMVS